MQLREIHIDGFGVFFNNNIVGLKDGLNVVFGPNERGKTTLRTFIERVLFGFPTRAARTNQYPALAGGGYGGRLNCVFSDGRAAVISRKQPPKKGQLTIALDSEQLTGDDQLRTLTGNISQFLYHTVYSFNLDEFIDLDSEELKERVYGAAQGMHSNPISSVKATLRKQAEDLYKPGGQKPPINSLLTSIYESESAIAAMKAELAEYDGMVNQLSKLSSNIDQLKAEQKKIKDEIRDLEYKKTQFPAYVGLASAKDELAALPDVPAVSEETFQEFTAVTGEIKVIDTSIRENKKEMGRVEQERGQLAFNNSLIEKESTVNSLVEQAIVYANALKDKSKLSLQNNELKIDIDTAVNGIGSGWRTENTRAFQFNQVQKDLLKQFADRFKKSAESIMSNEAKLLATMERAASAKPQSASAWGQVRIPFFVLMAIASAGLATGLAINQTWLSVFAGLMLSILGLLMVFLRKIPAPAMPDAQEELYLSELEELKSKHSTLEQAWQEFLGSCGFARTLSCEGTRSVIDAIGNIQSDLKLYDENATRLQRMEETIQRVEKDYKDVCQCVPTTDLSGAIEADIKFLSKNLSASKSARERDGILSQSIERCSKEIVRLQGLRDEEDGKLSAILISFNCAEENEFRTNYGYACQRDDLNRTIAERKKQIQAVSGTGELFDSFIDYLSQTDRSSIESALEEARQSLSRADESITSNSETVGELKLKLEHLANDMDIYKLQERVEAEKQNLRDLAMDWARAQLAVTLIDKAVLKYEKTGQPAVLKAATTYFSAFTGGAYSNIYKPAQEEGLRVTAAALSTKTVDDLSTGTVQQLYLAIRFGLIQTCERQTEPMPIIMDDLLVNFDDIRTQAAMQQIVDFAQGRQVIYLTCHGATCDAFAKLGIEAIEI